MNEDDLAAVVDVYRSGWLSQGPCARAFEEAIERYTGSPHAVAVTNCTVGLHLMALTAGLGPGDEVIVPSLSFVATANSIAYTGATPVFADVVSPTEPWLDPDSVERCVTTRTRAVVCMQYGGHPGESGALRKLADRHGLVLLEDSAHALGTRIGSEHAGTLGFAGAYSFFSNKNLPIGEGGMVVFRDADAAAQARLLRSHGMTTLSWQRHQGHAASYDVVALGHNFRIDEARSALGLSRLSRLDDDNRLRAAIDARYREQLEGTAGVTAALPPPRDSTLAHHLFAVVLDPAVNRDSVRERLSAAGIQTSVHYPPIHRFRIYAEARADLPVTDEAARRLLTLPLFPHMSEEQVDLVATTLQEVCA
jgi:dTDP-4-amino-4,6-dideoxygalactose transaminase